MATPLDKRWGKPHMGTMQRRGTGDSSMSVVMQDPESPPHYSQEERRPPPFSSPRRGSDDADDSELEELRRGYAPGRVIADESRLPLVTFGAWSSAFLLSAVAVSRQRESSVYHSLRITEVELSIVTSLFLAIAGGVDVVACHSPLLADVTPRLLLRVRDHTYAHVVSRAVPAVCEAAALCRPAALSVLTPARCLRGMRCVLLLPAPPNMCQHVTAWPCRRRAARDAACAPALSRAIPCAVVVSGVRAWSRWASRVHGGRYIITALLLCVFSANGVPPRPVAQLASRAKVPVCGWIVSALFVCS